MKKILIIFVLAVVLTSFTVYGYATDNTENQNRENELTIIQENIYEYDSQNVLLFTFESRRMVCSNVMLRFKFFDKNEILIGEEIYVHDNIFEGDILTAVLIPGTKFASYEYEVIWKDTYNKDLWKYTEIELVGFSIQDVPDGRGSYTERKRLQSGIDYRNPIETASAVCADIQITNNTDSESLKYSFYFIVFGEADKIDCMRQCSIHDIGKGATTKKICISKNSEEAFQRYENCKYLLIPVAALA